jgi:hypothetical protein
MHEQINDLFQFELNKMLINNSITLNLELYKLTHNFSQSKLISLGTLTFNYADFYANSRKVSVSLSGGNSYNSTLKVRFFKLNAQQCLKNCNSRNSMLKSTEMFSNEKVHNFLSERIYLFNDMEGTIDLEKLEAAIDPMFELKTNDFVLIRKILILFSHLNTKTLHTSSKQDSDKDFKRITKNRITFKLYELFIRLVSQLDSIEHFEYLYADLATSISDGNLHSKQIVQCLLNILKDLFDSDLFTSVTYELTLECMDLLIKMLVDLSKLTSKSSLFELKYSLNDLILNKLVKQIRNSQIKMYLAYCKLNLRFLNYLYVSDEFFNGNELAILSIKLLSFDGSNADMLNENVFNSIINLFNLDVFQNNFQFRDRLIELLINLLFE